MLLYNTLTRRKEVFAPGEPGKAKMYCCGPTVYGFAHIGNMRTYLFMDWLRRCLRLCGYTPYTVMNITDVGHLVSDADEGEDKMAASARKARKTPREIADEYTAAFFADIDALNITRPEITPKATEHIPQMLAFTQGLLDKGYGYIIGDGVYFDISRFPAYGALSGTDIERQQAGARVEVNSEKRHPADFALWKFAAPEHIMQWPSPWGMGYPGWHIECSAMAREYLGDVFDIHTGGVDHIPVHHENEIAQSEALLGRRPARYWLHGEFMLVNGGKMAKSEGNTYLLRDLSAKGYSPLHFRLLCAQAHYRSKLNFTFEALEGAKASYQRLLALLRSHADGAARSDTAPRMAAFAEAARDDLNIPKALGVFWGMLRREDKSRDVYAAALEMDNTLGLGLREALREPPADAPDANAEHLDAEAERLLALRQEARANKDYARADGLRELLQGMGITLEDTKEGVKWKKN
ncbi:MAG: cysteine--tRNA ligase [Oscillospiraceae bacterium]|jgi:cysteinyl-tRNA synthetase|nr:cysteine--tRNA ligase [Oscillospiraceae bacterium]